jgi:hypothetical protein
MIGCVSIFALMLCGSPAIAQNMVSNSDFNDDIAGWILFSVPIEWDASDWEGSPTSGSARFTNDVDGTMHAGTVTCVDGIDPGQSYDLGGMIRVPSGQSGSGFTRYGIHWWAGPGCTGTQSSDITSPLVTESDSWIHVALGGITPPSGTQSAWIGFFNYKTSAGTASYVSYHDAVYFGVFGGIFTDGFQNGSTSEWSATAP